MNDNLPLSDLRVIELATEIAGGYAGKMFRDAGAEVIKVEPAGGDPLRQWQPTSDLIDGDSPLFRFLAAGKRSLVGDPGDPGVDALLADADVIIQDGVSDRALRPDRFPDSVILSLSPFGTAGPWRDRPATWFTVQADSGSIHGRGRMGQEPFHAGGRITEFTAASYGAVGALAATRHRQRTGRGSHIDVSLAEASAVSETALIVVAWYLFDCPPGRPPRHRETPGIERAKDGWVGLNCNALHQVHGFLDMMGRNDLKDDPEIAIPTTRSENAEFMEFMTGWLARHTVDEILAMADERRVPCAPVGNGQTVTAFDHFVHRGVYRAGPDGMVVPRRPYAISGVGEPDPDPHPEVGAHTGKVGPRDRSDGPSAPDQADQAPLAGLRVLDVTSWWAGPSASHLLACLGAEVIHVESTSRPDPMRGAFGMMFMPAPGWWERSNIYQGVNTNKLGITLDLASDEGRDLALQLAARSDVVMENFTPRVMDGFGLSWEAIHGASAETTMVRMPAYGLSGPWRDKPGFAQNIEQVSGMAWVTGGDEPVLPRGICDPLAGAHAAFATLVALDAQRQEGGGRLVEVAMVEAALNATAEQVAVYSLTGEVLGQNGNRGYGGVLQGLYRGVGNDEWVAVAVHDDRGWDALRSATGSPEWTQAPWEKVRDDPDLRKAFDDGLTTWLSTRDPVGAADLLAARGVAASRLWSTWESPRHPQFAARGFVEMVDHPVCGTLGLPGLPFRYSGVERWNRTHAPLLGGDNERVLGEILGLGPERLDELASRNVIGTEPTN